MDIIGFLGKGTGALMLLGACAALDRNLGKVIDRLKKEGLYENTVIIFGADHGSHFKTRNRDGHLNGYDDYKRSGHDAALRVPLVIAGGPFKGGKVEEQIVSTAVAEDVHLVGISILSGSHLPLVEEVIERMRAAGIEEVPLVVGGIIPDADAETLRAKGVARVYTPKDFELNRIMLDIVALAEAEGRAAA